MNMGKVAVFSDIHSNYYAFSACFEDALSKGAEFFVFLGDYITDFPDARKTMDLIYKIRSEYSCVFLRGNRERYMLEYRSGACDFRQGTKSGSWLYNYKQLKDSDLDFFESLPIYDNINLFGINFEISHSGKNDDRFYYEKDDANIDKMFSQMETAYLLTGHSHKQYIQTKNGKTIVNPGSIGVPRGYGGLTQYAILDIEDSNVACNFYQIEYDLAASIRHHFECGFVDFASCWAIAILYDAITGEEWAMPLLNRVYSEIDPQSDSVYDEAIWRNAAEKLGMKFTEKEIMEFANL